METALWLTQVLELPELDFKVIVDSVHKKISEKIDDFTKEVGVYFLKESN